MEPTLYIGITQSLFAGLVVITKKPTVLSNRILAGWLFMIVFDMLLALLSAQLLENLRKSEVLCALGVSGFMACFT